MPNNPRPQPTPEQWAQRLDAIARPVLDRAQLDDPASLGAIPPLAHALLAWRSARDSQREQPTASSVMTPDLALWTSLCANDPSLARATLTHAKDSERDRTDAGSLLPQGRFLAIEVWSESELASLQACAWWLLRAEIDGLEDTLRDAALWHLDNLQPDNATNHPWGIPAFLWLAFKGEPGSRDTAEWHCETLLHNALSSGGEPVLTSALILEDAAAWLRAFSSRGSATR